MMYKCVSCKYETNNRYNYEVHLKTLKHLNKTKTSLECPTCGKQYKYASSLEKHIQRGCGNKNNHSSPLIQENSNLKGTVDELKQIIKDMIPHMGGNHIKNNKISINVFLNEQCKDAINMDDFLKKINITMDDLLKTRKLGFSQGISNIFIKELNEIESTKRPIHCSDKKRLKFYVKNENEWNKDENGDKIENVINHISRKQILTIKEWESENPNWDKCEAKTNEYLEILKQVMGGRTEVEKEKYKKDIAKNIGENTFFKQ
jgi:hypothetical protein